MKSTTEKLKGTRIARVSKSLNRQGLEGPWKRLSIPQGCHQKVWRPLLSEKTLTEIYSGGVVLYRGRSTEEYPTWGLKRGKLK
jgi:hypothetical protein